MHVCTILGIFINVRTLFVFHSINLFSSLASLQAQRQACRPINIFVQMSV